VVFVLPTAAKALLGIFCCSNRIHFLCRYNAEFVTLATWWT